MKKIAFIVIAFFLFVSIALAETVILKGGGRVDGQIVEKTDKLLKINVRGVTLSYDASDIESIEGGAASKTPQNPSAVISPVQRTPLLPSIQESTASSPQSSGDELNGMTKDRLIIALIEASGARDKLNEVLSQAMAQTSPEQSEKLRQLFNIDEMINQVAPIYDKYFTEDELKDLTRFYKSSLGRKLFMVTPLIIEESTQASLAYFQNKIQAMNPQPNTAKTPPPVEQIP